MFQVKGIVLNNVVVFDKAQIPFKGKGLVVISGLNKDCTESDDQTNAVGKSLCLSALPNVFYYASPLATKKNSKKDMLGKKDSCITIYASDDSTSYKIEQKPKATAIYEKEGGGWVDQGYRTDKIQKEALASLFPLSQEEFYSYVYIQNQRSLEFQIGSPTTRLKFITKSFTQLGIYDQLHAYFSKQLSAIKKDEGKYDVLLNRYEDTVERRNKLELPENAQELYDDLTNQLDSLTNELDTLIEKETKLKTLNKVRERYQKQKDELKKILTELGLKAKSLRSAYKSFKKDLKAAAQLERYQDAKDNREQTVKSIKKKIAAIGKLKGSKEKIAVLGKDLRAEQKEVDAKLEELEEAKESYDEAKTLYEKLNKKLNALELTKAQLDISLSEVDEKIGLLKSNISLESLLHEHEDGQCPTCMQPIDVKRIKKMVKQAKVDLKELRTIREGLKLKEALADIKVPKKVTDKQLKALAKKSESIDTKLEALEVEYKKHTRLADLKEALADVPEVKKPKATFVNDLRDSSDIEERLEAIAAAGTLNEDIKSIEEEYPSINKGKSEAQQLEKITEKKSKLRKKQRKINDRHQKLSTAISNHELLSSQHKELRAEIKKIKPFIDKRKLYEELVAAYGNKGLKLQATDVVLKLLEDKMNEYSHIIFTEAVSFNIKTVTQGVTCTMKRGNGVVSDVSFLSGAETNCFRLLFMIAMLSLVPESRRTNFVVLDEADSAMSDASREKYITQFIPALREVIDKVFVITPKDINLYEDAEIWKVIKENGISRIFRNGKRLTMK